MLRVNWCCCPRAHCTELQRLTGCEGRLEAFIYLKGCISVRKIFFVVMWGPLQSFSYLFDTKHQACRDQQTQAVSACSPALHRHTCMSPCLPAGLLLQA